MSLEGAQHFQILGRSFTTFLDRFSSTLTALESTDYAKLTE